MDERLTTAEERYSSFCQTRSPPVGCTRRNAAPVKLDGKLSEVAFSVVLRTSINARSSWRHIRCGCRLCTHGSPHKIWLFWVEKWPDRICALVTPYLLICLGRLSPINKLVRKMSWSSLSYSQEISSEAVGGGIFYIFFSQSLPTGSS